MRRAILALAGAASLTLASCGADADKGVPADAPEDVRVSEEVGVTTSELTNCTRTELANVVVGCGGPDYHCDFRLMEDNLACSEGVVGQASTEVLTGTGVTSTAVSTLLFEQPHQGYDNNWNRATIATQWGHAYASTHLGLCKDGGGNWRSAIWRMDPWTKQAVLDPAGGSCR